MADCMWCNGPLEYLGTLGELKWFRCRDCGADHSVSEHPVETEGGLCPTTTAD